MSVIAFTDGVSATEREEIDYLIRRQIDGFLIVPADSSAPHLNSPKMVSIPRVFFDQPVDDSSADAVLVKNRQAARIAVEHLIEHGHRHIACIGINRHLYSVRKRIQGYRDAMKAAGLSDCVAGPDSAGIDAQIGKWLRLKNKPTAIFSLNEGSTVKVIESLANHRVPIPTGMAFIGFDEVMFGNFLESPLTTIVQPATEIGERAAQLLLERIESGEALPGKHILLNPSFIRRGSCGCNPAQPTVSYLLDTHQSHPVIS
jgi:LacI family transcriptional regulator